MLGDSTAQSAYLINVASFIVQVVVASCREGGGGTKHVVFFKKKSKFVVERGGEVMASLSLSYPPQRGGSNPLSRALRTGTDGQPEPDSACSSSTLKSERMR